MNAHEALMKAKELISDPEKWIQGSFAKNSVGDEIFPQSDYAVCWCSIGALEKFCHPLYHNTYLPALDSLRFGVYTMTGGVNTSVAQFNDTMKHSEVMGMWDIAIKRAKDVS